MNENIYLLALKKVKGVGDVLAGRLVKGLGSAKGVFMAGRVKLKAIEGISEQVVEDIVNYNDWGSVKDEVRDLEAKGIKIVNILGKEYPENLKNIYSYPTFLYCRGILSPGDGLSLAVVGSREYDEYGKDATRYFVKNLSLLGITIVSGFARGIDTIAHTSCLRNDGRTVAVLGSGIDVCYPPENKRLYDQICESGAVLSEYGTGIKPESGNFPKRNKIISGLSLGVIIIQARKNSGALITANYAVEQNREVFAVPGNINNPRNYGCNQLIRKGAVPASCVEDVLSEIEQLKGLINKGNDPAASDPATADEEEVKILAILNEAKLHIDQLKIAYDNSRDLYSLLLAMEIKGLIRPLPGNYYERSS